MATFENVLKRGLTPEELQQFAVLDEALESEAIGSREVTRIDCEITRDRIAMFHAAHDGDYACNLYEVMKTAGFTPRYLSFLTHMALMQSGESHE